MGVFPLSACSGGLPSQLLPSRRNAVRYGNQAMLTRADNLRGN